MKIYACIRQGTASYKSVCDDRILVGNVVLDNGYYETETQNPNLVLAVSDGVGSSGSGWKAASLTLEGLRLLTGSSIDESNQMIDILANINEEVKRQSRNNEEYNGMAATLSMLHIKDEQISYYQLGDSRIYSLNEVQGYIVMKQLTTDQNNLSKWMKENSDDAIDTDQMEEELRQRMGWNAITGYIGMNTEKLRTDIQYSTGLSNSGTYIITSDGIHDYLSKQEFRNILTGEGSIKDKMKMLMELAVENGSSDDQSIIIAQI